MPRTSKKSRSKRKGGGDDSAPIVDERFAAASNRPQFRTATKTGEAGGAASGLLVGGSGASKVELDERFAAALTDPRFRIGGDTGDVDKYGRKRGGKKSKKKGKTAKKGGDADDYDISDDEEGMGKFYTLKKKNDGKQKKIVGDDDDNDSSSSSSSESSSDQEESDAEDDRAAAAKKGVDEDDVDESGAPESNDPEARIAYLTALSRGEIDASSSSSDASSSDDDDGASSDDDSQSDDATDEDSVEGRAGVLDPSAREDEEDEVEITHEASPYLAVCNMDWTQVRAVDLFAILSSFCPPGSVKRVRIYPSDFGMERMKKEESMGPAGIWKKQKGSKKNGENAEEDYGDQVNERFGDDDSSEEGHGSDQDNSDDEQDMDEEDVDLDAAYEHFSKNPGDEDYGADNDYDPEKLRAYEASKMKYYFAVATFASSEAADAAYREVDGMEVGHSSAMIDLRSIPPSDIKSVVKDREVRDECDALPSTYESPDFVVAALQQTAVRCTWEDGDAEREKKLTQYGVGNEAWAAMTEGDDLKAYLASDHSSDEDSDAESDGEGGGGQKDKGARMRALLGLGSDDEGGFGDEGGDAHSDASSTQSTSDSDEEGLRDEHDDDEEEEGVMTTTYIPGKRGLEDKIRDKLEAKKGGGEESAELTPWEKYQLKRKEKRRERRQAVRAKRKDKLRGDDSNSDDESDDEAGEEDGFFLGDDDDNTGKKKNSKKKSNAKKKHGGEEDERRAPSTKEELELLIAGDNDEEAERDFDMRGIARKEKLKGKKLKGKRKRKEAEKAADVSGAAFHIDTTDSRFAAVLDGSDERFGIDRTDPSFKDTPAMQKVLTEQSKRRKAKKRAKVANDVSVDAINRSDAPTGGAAALSSLVKSLKTKVANKK
mmetsp:Transcript_20257/g.58122  ORF Transcript_20257/g.58122 Transcript_20257/m.58122 type:complete len:884 (+) Transcript_20257:52-2703(+)